MEITVPETIRFDFLLTLIGLGASVAGVYCIHSFGLFAIGAAALFVGLGIAILGINRMHIDYSLDTELKILAVSKQQHELIVELKQMDLISERTFIRQISLLRERLQKI